MAISATVACSRSASSAILAFSDASIFRLGFVVIVCSIYHDRAYRAPIKPLVPNPGSTSLRRAVAQHYPLDWKEDVVTHTLVRRLRNGLRQVTVHGPRFPLNIQWEAYKLHGRREVNHGDIGVLVRYRAPTTETIEGAGFLEAKLRGRDTNKFQQVRHEQVTRILARSPQTRLLLYDYNPVPVLDPVVEADFSPWYRPSPTSHSRVSHGPVIPLQLAATINQYDDTLYRFCYSFSHQFARRYFSLHDLDFTPQAIQAVKGFPSELGAVNFVMVLRIAPQGQELPEPFKPGEGYQIVESE